MTHAATPPVPADPAGPPPRRRALVTGATGYIGGRLAPRLIAEGYTVRAMTRQATRLRDIPWAREAEVVEADSTRPETLAAAMREVDVAYYLIHSIDSGGDFGQTERASATAFAEAAAAAGVSRIVYLGGMVPDDEELSAHLASRAEVGQVFLAGPVPAAVLQAAVIIGSGSASFEMLRYLTERLPAMVAPKWVRNRVQPIAVRDVLRYLVAAAQLPPEVHRAFDIGGPDVLTYQDMMQRYAAAAGLRRRIIVPVPVLSASLSSHWVNVVTPVPAALARPLVRSLVHEVVCSEHDITRWIPEPPGGLLGVDGAIELALQRVREQAVETRWSSATWRGAPSDPLPSDPSWAGGSVYLDEREAAVEVDPGALWRVIEGIGGENGWYSFPLAWAVRGHLDRLAGGVGLRRGRRNQHTLYVGESLDWWRVEEVISGRLLRLRAEMKVPGDAWLELSVITAKTPATTTPPAGAGRAGDLASPPSVTYRQRAIFHPRGLAGHVYWWAIWPFHGLVFGGMLRNITAAARALASDPAADAPGPASASRGHSGAPDRLTATGTDPGPRG